jgi:hypothetical protein
VFATFPFNIKNLNENFSAFDPVYELWQPVAGVGGDDLRKKAF